MVCNNFAVEGFVPVGVFHANWDEWEIKGNLSYSFACKKWHFPTEMARFPGKWKMFPYETPN